MSDNHLWTVVVPLIAAAGISILGVLFAVYAGMTLDQALA